MMGSNQSYIAPIPVLSAFIIAEDEADRLPKTLTSLVNLVDDLVLVDSGSQDDTLSIAREFGARTFERAWQGYGPQKRHAEGLCRHDWVLNIDADEVVTPELAEEIRALFRGGAPAKNFFRIRIREVLPGRQAPRRFGKVYDPVRLYNRRAGRYADSPTHDRVMVPKGAAIGQLSGHLIHYSFRSLSHFIYKLNRYSDLQVETQKAAPLWQLRLRLFIEFPFTFAKIYFVRGLITDGRVGFVFAMTYAFARFARIAKFIEQQERR
jgi:glycosyltransferase involved in cell wall biosynthesis